jgi:hypothetical protein
MQPPAPVTSQVPVVLTGQLFLRLTDRPFFSIALFLGHLDKTLALTGSLALAGIFCGFAVILSLATVDTEAFDFGSFSVNCGNGHGRKQRSCGRSQCNTGKFFLMTHDVLLVA